MGKMVEYEKIMLSFLLQQQLTDQNTKNLKEQQEENQTNDKYLIFYFFSLLLLLGVLLFLKRSRNALKNEEVPRVYVYVRIYRARAEINGMQMAATVSNGQWHDWEVIHLVGKL